MEARIENNGILSTVQSMVQIEKKKRLDEEEKRKEEFMSYFTEDNEEEIYEFIEDVVFAERRFMFVDSTTKIGYCTHCREEMKLDFEIHHNAEGVCPTCHSNVTIKMTRYGRKSLKYAGCFLRFNKVDKDTVTATGYVAERDYSKDYRNYITKYVSIGRYLFGKDTNKMYYRKARIYSTFYINIFDEEYARYYGEDEWRERKSICKYNIDSLANIPDYIDTNSFRKAIEGTRFQYGPWKSAIGRGAEISYLEQINKYPIIEQIYKLNKFEEIAMSKVVGKSTGRTVNWRAKNVFKALKINRGQLREIQNSNAIKEVTSTFLETYRDIRKDDKKISVKEIVEIDYLKNCTSYRTERVSEITKWGKLNKYLGKQIKIYKKETKASLLIIWLDYIEECKKLEYKLNDSTIFPPKLMKAHDDTRSLVKYKENEKYQKKIDDLKKQREQLTFNYKNLFIRAALSQLELIEEGEKMHHCVGGYSERYSEGETNILFIRKVDEPDTPYFTVEIANDYRVIQVRGKRNGMPTSDVDEFMEEYKKKLAILKQKGDMKTWEQLKL